jgi:pyridoxine 4-dehydrogenase
MSARRLGLERTDLYYLHSGRAQDATFEDQLGTLTELQHQGFIRHIGLSNITPEQFAAASEIVDIAAVTSHFNVVAREQAALVEAVIQAGAVFVPWQPVFAEPSGVTARSGRFGSGSSHSSTDCFHAWSHHFADRPGLASGAITPHHARSGTTSRAHLLENLDAQDIRLSSDQIQAIDG